MKKETFAEMLDRVCSKWETKIKDTTDEIDQEVEEIKELAK